MTVETRGWMLETLQNLKLKDLAVDCIQKEREREKDKAGSNILNLDVYCNTITKHGSMNLSSEIR